MSSTPAAFAPRCFSVPVEDGVLHLQLVDLGSQACPQHLFVWLGHSAPQLSNLAAATPMRLSSIPAVSSLLGNDEGASLAQRLALKTGRPVVVSSNLPSESPLLLAVAEKYLVNVLHARLDSRSRQEA